MYIYILYIYIIFGIYYIYYIYGHRTYVYIQTWVSSFTFYVPKIQFILKFYSIVCI